MSKRVPYDQVANGVWTVLQEDDGLYCPESVHRAILLDIRQELYRLNSILACANFIGIPTTLRQIQRNTAKRKPKAKK